MTRRLRITFKLAGVMMLVYSLLRLGFLLVEREYFEGTPAGEVAFAFVHGLRFDVAALVLLNVPVLLAWNLGLPRVAGRGFKTACFVPFAALNVLGVMLNVADYGYFPNVQRRLLYEPFDRPRELVEMVPQWFREYPLLCGGVLLAGAAFVTLLLRVSRRIDRRTAGPEGAPVPTLVSGAVLACVCVLGVRGGIQEGILRPADAFAHSASGAVGYLALNSTYTVALSGLLTALQPSTSVHAMPDAEAAAVVADLLVDADETRPDPRWPFARTKRPAGPLQRRNVVLFLMESWTWAHVGPHVEKGVTISRTPSFDALAKEGLLFTNFLASGEKSNQAIPSLLTSVPNVFHQPVIGSRVELTRFHGLGNLLKPHGWATSFHYAADKSVMGFDAFGRMAGMDTYRSEADFPDRSAAVRDGRWGIFDHLFYADTGRWLDREAQPFFALVFSLSPHDPYKIPPDLEARFQAPFAHETGYQRCLRYSDWALGEFMAYARTRPWFAQTLFVVTADHTRFSPPNSYYESFHVPLLLYAPGWVEPGTRDEIGFHPDVLPTVLDLLQVPCEHASMGRSLMPRGVPRRAFVHRDQGFAVFDSTYALLHDLRRDVGLFDYRADATFQHDLSAREPARAASLRRDLLGYLQAVTTAVEEDRVVRPQAAPR